MMDTGYRSLEAKRVNKTVRHTSNLRVEHGNEIFGCLYDMSFFSFVASFVFLHGS